MTRNATLTLNTALNITGTTVSAVRNSDDDKKAFILALSERGKCIDLDMISLVNITKSDLHIYFQNAISNLADTKSLALVKTLLQHQGFMSSLEPEQVLGYVKQLSAHVDNHNATHVRTILLRAHPLPKALQQTEWLLATPAPEPQPTPSAKASIATAPISSDSPIVTDALESLKSMDDLERMFDGITAMDYSVLRDVLIRDTDQVIVNKVVRYLSSLDPKDFSKAIVNLTKFHLYLFLVKFDVWSLVQTRLEACFNYSTLSKVEIKMLSRVIRAIVELPADNILQLLGHALIHSNSSVIHNWADLRQELNAYFRVLIGEDKLPQAMFLLNLMPFEFLTISSIKALMGSGAACVTRQSGSQYEQYLGHYGLSYSINTRVEGTSANHAQQTACKDQPDIILLSPCAELEETEVVPTPADAPIPLAAAHTHDGHSGEVRSKPASTVLGCSVNSDVQLSWWNIPICIAAAASTTVAAGGAFSIVARSKMAEANRQLHGHGLLFSGMVASALASNIYKCIMSSPHSIANHLSDATPPSDSSTTTPHHSTAEDGATKTTVSGVAADQEGEAA